MLCLWVHKTEKQCLKGHLGHNDLDFLKIFFALIEPLIAADKHGCDGIAKTQQRMKY
jgi:hypothetical protein